MIPLDPVEKGEGRSGRKGKERIGEGCAIAVGDGRHRV